MRLLEVFIPAPTVAQRVRYGAAILDERTPGWASAVDPESLDLAKADQCILGQLFGTFRLGTLLLYGEEMWRAAGHGFDIDTDDEREEEEYQAEFDMLTSQWQLLLEERNSAPVG